MKAINYFLTFLLLNTTLVFSQSIWEFDKSHTNVGFTVKHLVISEVDGNFSNFDGKVSTKGEDFSGADVEFTVDINSINTNNENRDNHLKSDDFFNAEKFPEMTFKSKSMEKAGDDKYLLVGDLTIRDVTKEINLDVTYNGSVKDPWGNTKAGFKLIGELNRFDYNLKWNKTIETGGLVVGEKVKLNLNVQLTKK